MTRTPKPCLVCAKPVASKSLMLASQVHEECAPAYREILRARGLLGESQCSAGCGRAVMDSGDECDVCAGISRTEAR